MTSRRSVLFFFFFQAEDGIRDLVRSRGLGDVYKRQMLGFPSPNPGIGIAFLSRCLRARERRQHLQLCGAVSYTHLTLPTSDLV